jgi:hypothetical protein
MSFCPEERLLALCDAMSEPWSRPFALFRSLVPSWRFFDRIEPVPALHYRFATAGDSWSEWQDALTAPSRTPASLLSNAAGNLHLACQSLIEHLVADVEEAAELGRSHDELVSYRLVCALVEQRVRSAQPACPRLRYQFRLAEPGAAPVFSSRVHVT